MGINEYSMGIRVSWTSPAPITLYLCRYNVKGAGDAQLILIPIEYSMGIIVSETSPAPFTLYLYRYNVK